MGYSISKDIIANFNFSLKISAKIKAQKGKLEKSFKAPYFKENLYFLFGRTNSGAKVTKGFCMKFYAVITL